KALTKGIEQLITNYLNRADPRYSLNLSADCFFLI
ncbi:MAG: hypothetical protein ACI8T1_002034, partial [Verrucomicrobiales bacterium]